MAPGSRTGAGSGVDGLGGAAFSLFVSWEEAAGEVLAASFSVEGPGSAESSSEGGRGARNRGSGAGGGWVVTEGWGMRGIGKSLWAAYISTSVSGIRPWRRSVATYLVDARYNVGEQKRPCRAAQVVTC